MPEVTERFKRRQIHAADLSRKRARSPSSTRTTRCSSSTSRRASSSTPPTRTARGRCSTPSCGTCANRADAQPGILTRLDKDTSGLVVIALTPEVHAAHAERRRRRSNPQALPGDRLRIAGTALRKHRSGPCARPGGPAARRRHAQRRARARRGTKSSRPLARTRWSAASSSPDARTRSASTWPHVDGRLSATPSTANRIRASRARPSMHGASRSLTR